MSNLVNYGFKVEKVNFSVGEETIVLGGKKYYPLLKQVFDDCGIKQIAVIGYKSQGPGQSMNLRDSLASTNSKTKVVVGLREGSATRERARKDGFTEEAGTLLNVEDAVKTSDLVIVLISDSAQTQVYQNIFDNLKTGATLYFSHGFLLAFLESKNIQIRKDINIVMTAPKGMGDSVRRSYIVGEKLDGAGINASVAVYQDYTNTAEPIVYAAATGIGSPVMFKTSIIKEARSDLTGERAILLGQNLSISEFCYSYFRENGFSEYDSFCYGPKAMTDVISKMVSKLGLKGGYNTLTEEEKQEFKKGFLMNYAPSNKVIDMIYSNVCSGEEFAEVIKETNLIETNQKVMSSVEADEMWNFGKKVYEEQPATEINKPVAFAFGLYASGMFALVEYLMSKGHNASECCNESVIEIIDSLNPYMDARGPANMVDGCSMTARLGARKWMPVFKDELTANSKTDIVDINNVFDKFLNHPMHGDLEKCFAYRPKIDISNPEKAFTTHM